MFVGFLLLCCKDYWKVNLKKERNLSRPLQGGWYSLLALNSIVRYCHWCTACHPVWTCDLEFKNDNWLKFSAWKCLQEADLVQWPWESGSGGKLPGKKACACSRAVNYARIINWSPLSFSSYEEESATWALLVGWVAFLDAGCLPFDFPFPFPVTILTKFKEVQMSGQTAASSTQWQWQTIPT